MFFGEIDPFRFTIRHDEFRGGLSRSSFVVLQKVVSSDDLTVTSGQLLKAHSLPPVFSSLVVSLFQRISLSFSLLLVAIAEHIPGSVLLIKTRREKRH